MEYDLTIILKMKVNTKVNNVFGKILDELPKPENTLMIINGGSYLSTTQNGKIINYDSFYKIIYECVQEYMPNENENILLKLINNIPRTVRNVQRIGDNREILKFQNEILNKYFYEENEENIKEKIRQLKEIIDNVEGTEDIAMVDKFLDNFEQRMQDGLGKDLQQLQEMLDNRR